MKRAVSWICLVLGLTAMAASVKAQGCASPCPQCPSPMVSCGSLSLPLQNNVQVVTCSNLTPPPSCTPVANDPVLGIVDMRTPPGACLGVNWAAPMYHDASWNAHNLGQVFGICLDDANPPNIYVTSTTLFGNFGTLTFSQNSALWGTGIGPLDVSEAIYRIDGITGAISLFQRLDFLNPTSNAGLGNICFDKQRDRFYVTNFADGKIYGLDDDGNPDNAPQDTYDPTLTAYPAVPIMPGFVTLGERLWGIGFYQDRVYFGVWACDKVRNHGASIFNSIWSVAINAGTGLMDNSTFRHELDMPHYGGNSWSNPVSDIEFSANGRMLVAERTMQDDYITSPCNNQGAWAHSSRVIEFVGTWPNWYSGLNYRVFATGSHAGASSAGGVDYPCDPCMCVDCGTAWDIYGTADAIHFAGGDLIYGLFHAPCSPLTTQSNFNLYAHMVDLDCDLGVSDKTRIGDVDVMRNCDSSSIHGTKWHDIDGDGTRDPGEPGIAGWTINIVLPDTTVITVTTDDDGNYWVMDLAPGSYTVYEQYDPNWIQTAPLSGSYQIELDEGESSEGNDFGNRRDCDNGPQIPWANPPLGLVSWWPLDEWIGGISHDIAGYHDGAWIGGPQPISAGKVKGAMQFWTSSTVTVPHHADYNFGAKSFSIDAWIRVTLEEPLNMYIVDKRNTTPYSGFSLYLNTVGQLTLEVSDVLGNTQTHSAGPNLMDGQWHCVAAVCQRLVGGQPNELALYIDGQWLPGYTVSCTVPGSVSTNVSLQIGAPSFGGHNFLGDIDELEIFNRAITGMEVQEICQAGSFGKCATSCDLPWDVSFCQGLPNTPVNLTICNYTTATIPYTWSVAGLSCSAAPTPNQFSPSFGSVSIPAGQCVHIPITITIPPGLLAGQITCFKATVINEQTGQCCFAEGSLLGASNRWWIGGIGEAANFDTGFVCCTEVIIGDTGTIRFDATKLLPGLFLPYSISVMEHDTLDPVVSLNGLPPGSAVTGTLTNNIGTTAQVNVSVEFTRFEAMHGYDVMFDADYDADGDWDTPASLKLIHLHAPIPPDPPIVIIYRLTDSMLLLEWDTVLNADAYRVYSSNDAASDPETWTLIGETDATSYAVSSIPIFGSTRFFVVKSVCDNCP